MLLMNDGHNPSQVADEMDFCRQTVSEIRRSYLIFGPEGIDSRIPKLGRKYCAIGGRLRTILEIAQEEKSIDGHFWTEKALSRRCEISNPTMHRLLKRHEVILKNSLTIDKALSSSPPHPIGIAGFLKNSSLDAMAFWCNSSDSCTGAVSQMTSPALKVGNPQAFITKQLDQFEKSLQTLEKEVFSASKSDRHNHRDMLRLMDILKRKSHGRRDLSFVINTTDFHLIHKLMRYVEGHHLFHILFEMDDRKWFDHLRGKFELIDEWNKRKAAMQMENINGKLEKWKKGQLKELSIFVWMDSTSYSI